VRVTRDSAGRSKFLDFPFLDLKTTVSLNSAEARIGRPLIQRRKMLRRGATYGPPLPEGDEPVAIAKMFTYISERYCL
jgi:hypothetical protein